LRTPRAKEGDQGRVRRVAAIATAGPAGKSTVTVCTPCPVYAEEVTLRLHIEFVHTLDPERWQRQHAAGLVPNRLPYGINRLLKQGFELEVRAANHSWLVERALGGAARRLSGGFELVDAAHDRRRRSCDLAVCWCERTGVPAAARSVVPGEPPVAMGTLWMTDPNAELSPWNAKFARWAVRQAVSVWANSRAQLDVLAGIGVARSRLHLLHTPGIDADFWYSERETPEPGLVLSVGNDRHRDHGFLIGAIRRLNKSLPASRLELVTHHPVVVPAELGMRHKSVSHTELRRLYGRAAVVAVALRPNLHISGATVILEAMACERAVVVTATPGYEEYVTHGETGFLVPLGDEEAFAAAVRELLEDPERAREMGRAGRKVIEEHFSSELTMAKLGQILRSAFP
jgi:glycosyltransferase involved in cell wall biosynthesis